MSKKMIDLVLNIDSLILEEDDSIDRLIDHIREKYSFGYEPTYEVLYEEEIKDE